jgi:8-oxo-dGTP pyrophosphatase MutT (NUDIX family)
VWIVNSRGEYLITQRAPEKRAFPLLWEAPGGSVLAGEDSLAAALRETGEETGFVLRPENGALFTTWRRPDSFADVWLFRQEVSLADFVPRPGETIDARLALPGEILAMQQAGTFFRNAYMEEMFRFAAALSN